MRINKETLIRVSNFLVTGMFSGTGETCTSENFGNELLHASHHLVLPSLYFRSQQAGTFSIFSEIEKEYLLNVADLCKHRTELILAQVREITLALNAVGLEPVYLKGIANMLDGLYIHEAERVVGDIDLLLSPQHCRKAIEIFNNLGYSNENGLDATPPEDAQHYPPYFKEGEPCRIELHIEISREESMPLLSGEKILSDSTEVEYDGIHYRIPEAKHRVLHNFIHSQLRNNNYKDNVLDLRQLLDFHLLILKYQDTVHLNEIISAFSSRKTQNALKAYCIYASKLLNTPVPESILKERRPQFKLWIVLMWLDASTGVRAINLYSRRLYKLPLRLVTPAWYRRKVDYLKTPREDRNTFF